MITTLDTSPTAVAAAAVAGYTQAYGDSVFADLADDGDLADDLLADVPTARTYGDLIAMGVSRDVVAAAFGVLREVVAADAIRFERRARR